MSVLRSRLLAMRIEEEQKKLTAQRRSQIGTGDRSEKYVPITIRKTALLTTALIPACITYPALWTVTSGK